MELPFRRKQEPQGEVEEITLTEEEANTVKKLIASGRARTGYDMDEWSFITETYEEAKKSNFVTKELALTQFTSAEERDIAELQFELLQYIHHNLPKSEESIRKTCFAWFYGSLWLNCSDKGWARNLMKTQTARLEKIGGEVKTEKKVV